MRKISKRIMAVVIIFSFVVTAGGCSSDEGTASNVEQNDNGQAQQGEADAEATGFQISETDQKLYDDLFSLDSQITVSIDISDEEMAKIEADYEKYQNKNSKSPIYRMCDMTISVNGEEYKIEEVGVRMKGNTSRTSFYNDNEGAYNLIHFKFSFDETFDDEEYYGDDAKVWASDEERQERKNRTFASLSGIEMKWNREVDSTYIRETYAFRMYRDCGLLAPNNTVGQCIINDESWGVYKIYEPVDKTFIERNFDEEDWGGDLYKCTWGCGPANYTQADGYAGVENEDLGQMYTYDLKTNKKTSKNESLKALIDTISKEDATREDIEKVVDVDNWLKFSAVGYFLGMPDDLRNNYNNHYVYFKGSTNQAVFIAYDCDICLGIDQWNPTGKFMTDADPYSDYAYGAGEHQMNELIVKTLTRDGLYEEEYTQALEEIASSKWMQFDTFSQMFEKVEEHYSDVIKPEREFYNSNSAQIQMSIDDTYTENRKEKKDSNLTVENYMERILKKYESYKE